MTKQKKYVISVMVAICLQLGSAQQKQVQQESCVSSKCHTTYGKEKYVHGPVAVGECSACHELAKSEKHKFVSIKKAEDLCVKCHEPMEKKGVVHAPVMTGDCTGCHNPHQSNQEYFMRKGPIAETCSKCHPQEAVKKKTVHGPLGDGDCLICHKPHSSEKPKLLEKVGNEVCFECHSDVQQNFADAKHVHKPASEGCIQCHNPHTTDNTTLLVKDQPELCFSCHQNIKDHVDNSTVQHAALTENKKCTNCHSPHESKIVKQLKDEPMKLCLTCHDHPMDVAQSGRLGNIKELLANNKNVHGPIRAKDCSGCHDVHGSTNFRILRKYYPKEFYTSYSQVQYELCFGCHQQSLTQEVKTATLTGFRDGNRNLHFVHVNKKIKGRTCRSCHETHASNNAKHIRDAVPFGQWMLPIKYEPTKNGGSCTPGCHAKKEYSRLIQPTANKNK